MKDKWEDNDYDISSVPISEVEQRIRECVQRIEDRITRASTAVSPVQAINSIFKDISTVETGLDRYPKKPERATLGEEGGLLEQPVQASQATADFVQKQTGRRSAIAAR